jgi:hypothetical protein
MGRGSHGCSSTSSQVSSRSLIDRREAQCRRLTSCTSAAGGHTVKPLDPVIWLRAVAWRDADKTKPLGWTSQQWCAVAVPCFWHPPARLPRQCRSNWSNGRSGLGRTSRTNVTLEIEGCPHHAPVPPVPPATTEPCCRLASACRRALRAAGGPHSPGACLATCCLPRAAADCLGRAGDCMALHRPSLPRPPAGPAPWRPGQSRWARRSRRQMTWPAPPRG